MIELIDKKVFNVFGFEIAIIWDFLPKKQNNY